MSLGAGRHECLRHVMAQVNFPNYPKSPADLRSSEFAAARCRFLADLETSRGNTIRTRNSRLAAAGRILFPVLLH